MLSRHSEIAAAKILLRCLPIAWISLAAARGQDTSSTPIQSPTDQNSPAVASPPATTLDEGFEHPSQTYGPWVFWRWPWAEAHLINNKNITDELEAMSEQGLGGVRCDTIGSPAPGKQPALYMSKAWLDLIAHARSESSRLGIQFFIDDCDGWATSGGPWITPETSMKELTFSRIQIVGPQTYQQNLPEPPSKLSFYRDIAVLAFPSADDTSPNKVLNVTRFMDTHGKLSWDVPAGKWIMLRVGFTTTGATNNPASPAGHGLECDKMGKIGVEAHLRGISPLTKTLTTNGTGRPLIGMDSWECGQQNWTDTLPVVFRERYGYDIIPWLPALLKQGNAPNQGRVEEDFDELRTWMEQHNYLAHFTELAHQAGLVVASQSIPEFSDYPEGEFWAVSRRELEVGPSPAIFKDDPLRVIAVPNDVPALSRGAGKNITGEEALTSRTQNWERTLFARKADVDWAYCLGANKIIFHLWCFQPDSNVKPTYCEHGTAINRNLTWWSQAHSFITYLTRCQYLLRQGIHVSDVDFVERREDEFIKNVFQEDFPAKYRYDITHWDGVIARMSARHGMVVTPEGYSYSLLVLPPGDNISLTAMRKIEELAKGGANILGQPRVRERGFADHAKADAEIQSISRELWGENPGSRGQRSVGQGQVFWGFPVDQVLSALKMTPDFHCSSASSSPDVDWNHRRCDGTDIYFVVNRAPKAVIFDAFFRASGKAPELWNPDTGERVRSLLYDDANGETRVRLRLPPFGSTFVIFRRPSSAHFISADSPLPGIAPITANDISSSSHGAVLVAHSPGTYSLTDNSGKILTLKVKAHPAEIPLEEPWKVAFSSPLISTTMNRLASWTENSDDRIKFYSGTATYTCHFLIPDGTDLTTVHWTLDLGDVHDMADVEVNKQLLATLWQPPFQTDVSSVLRTGDNKLQVTVVNSWLNRYLGDLHLPPALRTCTIGLSGTEAYTSDFPLPPSGILGPVVLRPESTVPIAVGAR